MKTQSKEQAIVSINSLAQKGIPFLFITDFAGKRNHVIPRSEVDQSSILFSVNGHTNMTDSREINEPIKIRKKPISFEAYNTKYNQVHRELTIGNTYLLNLTSQTEIDLDRPLRDVYYKSPARYKLWLDDEMVVFSPEIFVQIQNGTISSFPMKGTIDADLPDAKNILLSSPKEMAEHATIVDLIRNDMSIHAHNVRVENFRYIDEVRTSEKHLLQVSSKIVGELDGDYLSKLGEIIFSLLPAGSICGAPKKKTLDIIKEVEAYDRGYYTGVMGYFDGKSFDSGVMIRFIQKSNGAYFYKSGGGIHYLSDVATEYQEMIDKVYVPIH